VTADAVASDRVCSRSTGIELGITAGLALSCLDVIESQWLSASWMRSSRAGSWQTRDDQVGQACTRLDTIEPKSLSTGWTQSSMAVSLLAGNEQAGLTGMDRDGLAHG
jgi:hypothetical protein